MRVGIFGGTFDPPHIGHINALKAYIDKFNFEKVFVIPVFLPPHKSNESSVSARDRLNMSRLAFENLSKTVFVSDLEIKRKGKSYTADTIRYFVENGYDDIYFLCGTDMLLTLGTWYKPEYIFQSATIVYIRRENDDLISKEIEEKKQEYFSKYDAKILCLDSNPLEISSTEIRNSLEDNSDKFLSKEVYEYIKSNGLYSNR